MDLTPPANPPRDQRPNLNKDPLRTGLRGDTQTGYGMLFGADEGTVDRMSAGVIMLIVVAMILALGATLISAVGGWSFIQS